MDALTFIATVLGTAGTILIAVITTRSKSRDSAKDSAGAAEPPKSDAALAAPDPLLERWLSRVDELEEALANESKAKTEALVEAAILRAQLDALTANYDEAKLIISRLRARVDHLVAQLQRALGDTPTIADDTDTDPDREGSNPDA